MDDYEWIIELIEETANMLRGMCMDQRIPRDTRDAMNDRAAKLDAAVEAALAAKEE